MDAALRQAGPIYLADRSHRIVTTSPAFDSLWAAMEADGAPDMLREVFDRLDAGESEVVRDEILDLGGERRRFVSRHHRVDDNGYFGHYVEVLPDGNATQVAKNAFLSKMSHEMRTPLNAIIGFAEMSESQPFGELDKRYVGYLRNIANAARHLSGMISDLLELARVSPEPPEPDDAVVALSETLAEARAVVADLAARRGIDVGAVETGRDWWVAADRDRVHRICVNLLDNAVKFTEPGGRVGVEIARADEPGLLDIVFWDTGIGIARNRHDRIFESYHQVDPESLLRPSDGAGLGLAVSRHLARQMNGDIGVDSAPGAGARFTLRLPVASPGATE